MRESIRSHSEPSFCLPHFTRGWTLALGVSIAAAATTCPGLSQAADPPYGANWGLPHRSNQIELPATPGSIAPAPTESSQEQATPSQRQRAARHRPARSARHDSSSSLSFVYLAAIQNELTAASELKFRKLRTEILTQHIRGVESSAILNEFIQGLQREGFALTSRGLGYFLRSQVEGPLEKAMVFAGVLDWFPELLLVEASVTSERPLVQSSDVRNNLRVRTLSLALGALEGVNLQSIWHRLSPKSERRNDPFTAVSQPYLLLSSTDPLLQQFISNGVATDDIGRIVFSIPTSTAQFEANELLLQKQIQSSENGRRSASSLKPEEADLSQTLNRVLRFVSLEVSKLTALEHSKDLARVLTSIEAIVRNPRRRSALTTAELKSVRDELDRAMGIRKSASQCQSRAFGTALR